MVGYVVGLHCAVCSVIFIHHVHGKSLLDNLCFCWIFNIRSTKIFKYIVPTRSKYVLLNDRCEHLTRIFSMCLMSCCKNVTVFSKNNRMKELLQRLGIFFSTNHLPLLIVFIILFCHTKSFHNELLIVYHKNCYSSPRH